MPEENFNLEFRTKGADAAAKDTAKVTEATEQLEKKTGTSAEATDKATEAQEKLNAAESDYITLLAQVDPKLASLADGLLKGSKIAGDFANEQISLGDAFNTATTAIAANANTLKLLGSAAVAGAGFLALAKSISAVREESAKLREELDELRERATSTQGDIDQAFTETVELSRQRQEGVVGADERRSIEEALDVILRSGTVSEGLQGNLQANLAGLVGRLSGPEIETLTLGGFRSDLGVPPEAREARARAALRQGDVREEADREREGQRADRQRRAAQALDELRNFENDQTIGTRRTEGIVERLGIAGDRESVVDLARRVHELQRQIQSIDDLDDLDPDLRRRILARGGADTDDLIDIASEQRRGFFTRGLGPGDSEVTRAETARLLDALKELNVRLDQNTEAINNNGGGTVINNSRIVVPDASAQRRNTVNGLQLSGERER